MAVGDDLLGAVTLVDSLLANGAGFLVPGEIETGTLTHVVTADDLDETITNIATATSTQAPTVTASNTVPVVQAVLTVSKTETSAPFPGSITDVADVTSDSAASATFTLTHTGVVATDITYTITVSNTGTGNAAGITLNDTIILTDVDFVSATGGGTLSGYVVTWNLADIAAGNDTSVTLTVQTRNP